jgi:hypothetical protein
MCGYIDIAASSSSDPGRSGTLSPYCDMTSLYFDNSLYENEMHYRIANLLDTLPETTEDDAEELRIICDNEEEYNSVLDALFRAGENKLKISGTSNNPMEIIVEKDPRESYRKFDESLLMNDREE